MGERPRAETANRGQTLTAAGPNRHSVARIQRQLLDWYAGSGRDLPWRQTRDPYAILVAEVMLQQTQVDRVVPKWHAWLQRFPTTHALAAASRADAIRAWQGLGYNLRAVRLHSIACQAVAEHDGLLPRSLAELMTLKGVGRYTAGAVACFAYEQPVAMVDTNIRRVLSRLFEIAPARVESVASALLPSASAAYAWNQALMDLGATMCRPRQPMCLLCPLVTDCGGPRETGSASRPGGAFRGSRRYYRGRVIDFLARLPNGDSVAADDLASHIAHSGEQTRVLELIGQLALDGLLEVDNQQRVRLPD